MKKRIFPFALTIICVFSMCIGATFAQEARASTTITVYSASASRGSSSGDIKINFDVQANSLTDSLGISAIKIYKSDGTYVTTINGSTSNGLIRNNASRHKSSYTYTGTSGTSYYAEVTVSARIGSDYDSRTVTTTTVKAP